jgi:hypothetical protein
MSMKYIQSGKLLQIKNIKKELMGIHHLGVRSTPSSQYGDSIEFLWVDTYLEDHSDPQYRFGFNYGGTEYSAYLHTMPMYNQHDHYRMNLYGPSMKEYSLYFQYNDFLYPTAFILSLIVKLNLAIC